MSSRRARDLGLGRFWGPRGPPNAITDVPGVPVGHATLIRGARPVEAATGGPVAEGNVGGGTGMICHGFKGGIGTASRVVGDEQGSYTVGILVQANHGRRDRFTVEGVPVGRVLGPEEVPLPQRGAGRSVPDGAGSIIGIIATDAPLLPHQCARLAQRAGLGIARLGAVGDHSSGDLFLAFATGNTSLPGDHSPLAEPLTTVTIDRK